MTWLRTPQAGGRRGPFRPRVEALEGRCVPTANFLVQGSTLIVVAPVTPKPGVSERVVITDNGGSGPNNVTAFSHAAFFPNVPINTVVVLTRGGNDNVSYNLAGDLVGQRTVLANLGGGNNTFTAFLRRNLLPGASLTVLANGGSNARLTADLIGNVGAGAVLNLVFNGQGGNSILDVFSATLLRVDAGAAVNINLMGGGRSDHIFDDFFGTLNGSYTVNAVGGVGNNKIAADLEVAPGSTGSITGSELRGGPRDDAITFLIHAPIGFSDNNQVLDGGLGGFDTSIRTTNVIVVNTESDTVVS